MLGRELATVFGGSGFLGSFVVKRLRQAGYVVRIASRDPGRVTGLRMLGPTGEVVPLFASFAEPATIARAVEDASLVVNLTGILAEGRRGDFTRVHADGADAIARAAADAGAAAFVHVSALGADPASDSLYGRSKAEGEARVRAAYPNAAILRPSVVFGPDDAFFNRFAGIARLAPVMPVFFGDSKLQPVYGGDVADAVMTALAERRHGLFELGGPDVMTFRAILSWILEVTGRNRPLLEIPAPVAFLQAAIAELVPGKPLTRDQLRMLAHDNVVSAGAADLASLGINPVSMRMVVPAYLARFRPGGGRRLIQA